MSCDPKEIAALMQTIPWFQELRADHFDRLVSISCIMEFSPGEVLFKEGDKEDYLYVVLEGRIGVEIFIPGRGRTRIFTAEPMDVLGWSSVTPVLRQRTASARTVLPSRLIAFDAQNLRQVCDEDPTLGYVVMRRMVNVVASRLMITRLQLMDMFAHPVVEESDE